MTVSEKGVEHDGETSNSDELVKRERNLDKKRWTSQSCALESTCHHQLKRSQRMDFLSGVQENAKFGLRWSRTWFGGVAKKIHHIPS